MGSPLTKDLAEKVVKKLGGVVRQGRKHDIVQVYHAGKLVAFFGLRRGSDRSMLHNYISSQLYVSQNQAYLLGLCPMTREQWIEVLRAKGKLA